MTDRVRPGGQRARHVRERCPTGRGDPALLLELCDERLGGGGVLPVWRQLEIRFELVRRAGEVAFVDERHAELIVRFRVTRVRGDRTLERFLRLCDLATVPQDYALVEQRIGVTAAATGCRETA